MEKIILYLIRPFIRRTKNSLIWTGKIVSKSVYRFTLRNCTDHNVEKIIVTISIDKEMEKGRFSREHMGKIISIRKNYHADNDLADVHNSGSLLVLDIQMMKPGQAFAIEVPLLNEVPPVKVDVQFKDKADSKERELQDWILIISESPIVNAFILAFIACVLFVLAIT